MSAPSTGVPSFLQSLKSLDIYRTVPKDLTEQTVAGASVSLVSAALILFLFLTEFVAYLSVDIRHELFVEKPAALPTSRWGFEQSIDVTPAYVENTNLMKINFNITLPRMACAITNVVVQDVLGSNIDVQSQIHKYRTNKEGQLKLNEVSGTALSGDYGVAKEQIDEGCCVVGHIKVKKVPGNFHFTSNAHPDILQLFFMGLQNGNTGTQGIGGNLNTSHIINELWFGETQDLREVGQTALAPLNGGTKWSLESEVRNGNEKSYEYFIKVIPTEFQRTRGPPIATYQYVSNSNEIIGRFRMPSVFFRYDVEPITVRIKQKSQSFAHFAVQCCAIIGGAISVMSLINIAIKGTIKTMGGAVVHAKSVN